MKYRIMQKGGFYYPQIKGWILWRGMRAVSRSAMITVSDANGIGATSKEDAMELVRRHTEASTPIYHEAI